MERLMVDNAMRNAEECEKKNDKAGQEYWLRLALLAEKFYISKEEKEKK
jgi:hypothetical protein